MSDPKLVIFDVDGTLIDSQAHITAAMELAFASVGLPYPGRAATLSIVGLSLPQAMARLQPGATDAQVAGLVDGYKSSFADLRLSGRGAELSPLYPGALAALQALADREDVRLAVATGKSRRGLSHVFALHGLEAFFASVQVADDHPSKPHPSMVLACLDETGVAPDRAVIVGDTSFDMEMGRAAGVAGLGVDWGYHPVAALHAAGAARVLGGFEELPAALHDIWGPA